MSETSMFPISDLAFQIPSFGFPDSKLIPQNKQIGNRNYKKIEVLAIISVSENGVPCKKWYRTEAILFHEECSRTNKSRLVQFGWTAGMILKATRSVTMKKYGANL